MGVLREYTWKQTRSSVLFRDRCVYIAAKELDLSKA